MDRSGGSGLIPKREARQCECSANPNPGSDSAPSGRWRWSSAGRQRRDLRRRAASATLPHSRGARSEPSCGARCRCCSGVRARQRARPRTSSRAPSTRSMSSCGRRPTTRRMRDLPRATTLSIMTCERVWIPLPAPGSIRGRSLPICSISEDIGDEDDARRFVAKHFRLDHNRRPRLADVAGRHDQNDVSTPHDQSAASRTESIHASMAALSGCLDNIAASRRISSRTFGSRMSGTQN